MGQEHMNSGDEPGARITRVMKYRITVRRISTALLYLRTVANSKGLTLVGDAIGSAWIVANGGTEGNELEEKPGAKHTHQRPDNCIAEKLKEATAACRLAECPSVEETPEETAELLADALDDLQSDAQRLRLNSFATAIGHARIQAKAVIPGSRVVMPRNRDTECPPGVSAVAEPTEKT